MVPRVKITPLLRVLLPLAFISLAHAAPSLRVESLGNNTYSVVCQAGNGFTRDAEALKAQALDKAAAYCAEMHKEMKLISATAEKPKIMFTGYAHAKVVFKALDANDPELHAPVVNPSSGGTYSAAAQEATRSTDQLTYDLNKLDDLRKRGLISDEEFQTLKKKVLEKFQ
jgi:hypothetical protein